MKNLLLVLTLISCNASAVEFPSREVDRSGVPGNLKQNAASKLDCVKKISEAALQQMQIKGLELTKVSDQQGMMTGRNFDLTFKDQDGKEYLGSVRVLYSTSPTGVTCRPNMFDVADGKDGNLYRWQESGKGNGSVKYLKLEIDAEEPAAQANAAGSLGLQTTAPVAAGR